MAKAPYIITGPVGASKTSSTVSLIIDYLNEGRPVATNIDVFPERMRLTETGKKTPLIRIPDEPRSSDLLALGHAYDLKKFGYNERKNGMLALDETAFFLNSREWNKPDRSQLIKFLRLIRKKGWNAFLLVQDLDSLDSQVVNALCRTIGWCHTSDNLMGASSSGNPVAGLLMAPLRFGFKLFLKFVLKAPRIHYCTFYLGKSIANGLKQDTHTFYGEWYYDSYDTGQEFTDGGEFLDLPIRDSKNNVKVSFKVGNDIQYSFVPYNAALTNPAFTIERETVYRDMRASYSILPAEILHAWYPDCVPERPLTVAQTKAVFIADKAKDKPVKPVEKKQKPVFPVSFWVSLPLRVILFLSVLLMAKSSKSDWRFIAASYGLIRG